jgi:HEAT repeat protein
MRCLAVAIVLIARLPVQAGSEAAMRASEAADEKRLQQAGVKTDADSLLEFFRTRTVRVDQQQVKILVQQLSHRSFSVRKKASAALVALGARAVPLLRAATHDGELEVRRRAEECLAQIHNNSQSELILSAGRMLALRNPAGGAEALLDFLPSVVEDPTIRELHGVLTKLTVRDGKTEPAVVKALSDDDPIRRAAAAVALCLRPAAREHRDKVKALLRDRDGMVRAHAGMALWAMGVKEAIPVLIDLFPTQSPNDLWQAEDALYRLAQEKAPAVALGDTAESRKQFRDAWMKWWKENGDKLDVPALLKDVRKDYTLLVLLDEGEVLELDAKDKERFRMSKIAFPLDAQTLPGERVLLAEHGGNRVTERLRDGTVLWEKKVNEPLVAQRLANGRTFIGSKNAIEEVDREGKVVFSWSPPNQDQVMRVKKLDDGTIGVITHDQQRYTRLDAAGKELDGFAFNVNVHTFGGRVDVQPDGNVLIPQMYMNKVVEYDAKGKPVREFTVNQPIVASRLPNGNTIITSMSENRAVEFDSAGKQVWEYRAKSRVTRAYRR